MSNINMVAFHGQQEIKDKYITRVKNHAASDEIVKGQYWENGKGCAVGCTIEGSDHYRYEEELGIPAILAHLEDGLFEEMSNKDAMEFPLRFIEAIPVGVDLSKVFAKLIVWEWDDTEYGLKNIKEIIDDKELFDCCEDVVKLYKRFLNDEKVSNDEWLKIEDLAYKLYKARASARASARAFAWAFAWAFAGARAGARAGDGAWAWAGARARAGDGDGAKAEYEKQILITANQLIKILRESK